MYLFKFFPQRLAEYKTIEPEKKKIILGFKDYWIRNYFKTKVIMFPMFISFILILLKVPYGGFLLGLSMIYFGALYTYNAYHDTDFYKYAPVHMAPAVSILSSGKKTYHKFRKISVFYGVILIFSGLLLATTDLIYGPIIVDIFKRGLG